MNFDTSPENSSTITIYEKIKYLKINILSRLTKLCRQKLH